MTKEAELIRYLLKHCMEFEIESERLHRVIAAIRFAYPDIPALEALSSVRQMPEIEDPVREKYQMFFDLLDHARAEDILRQMPLKGRPN